MKRKLAFYFVLLVLILIGKNMLIQTYEKCYPPGYVQSIVKTNQKVNIDYLQDTEAYESLNPIVVQHIGEAAATAYGKEESQKEEVEIIASNYLLGGLEKLRFREGGFFLQGAEEEGRNHIVVSEELAESLFGSWHAVGNLCRIDDKIYQVVGVYKKYRWIGDYFSAGEKERVYVPIGSSVAPGKKLDEIIVSTEFLKSAPTEADQSMMGINSSKCLLYDASSNQKVLRTLMLLPLSLFLAGLIFYSIVKAGVMLEKDSIHWQKKTI